MTEGDIEPVYEALAAAIDAVGPERSEIFLAKLVLLLGREVGDTDRALALVAEAQRNL
jgi:hypothetical protein